MMRAMAKWLGITLASLILLILLTLTVFSSYVVEYVANNMVPGVTVESVSGSVMSELDVSGITYQDPQWEVSVAKVTLAHQWPCLLDLAVCIDRIAVIKPVITKVGEAQPTPEETPSSTEPLTLPVAISINELSITEFALNMPGQKVTVSSLVAEAQAHNSVTINDLHIGTAAVALTAEPATEPSSDGISISYTVPDLPEISLPIDITLNRFALDSLTVTQQQNAVFAGSITLNQFTAKAYTFSLTDLNVNSDIVTLQASTEATLKGDYPLMLTMQAQRDIGNEKPQEVSVELAGTLEDLQLAINATQGYQATVEGRANLLDATLPLTLDATWPKQPILAMPDNSIDAGKLVIKGKMGAYLLDLSTSANLPQVGATSVAANMVLTERALTVSEITIAMLKGTINSKGVLYLADGLSWQGITSLNGIQTQDIVAQGPNNIRGQFETKMTMTANGPDLLLTGLDIQSDYQNLPLTLSGDGVYSSNSNMMVSNIVIAQGNNTVSAIAQLIDQQYLDALVVLGVSELTTLYPEISGQITGTLAAKGEWQNPVVDSKIRLTDLLVSPELSEGLAQQGALNGTITLDGDLASHQLNADLQVPEYSTEINLAGQWQEPQWTGTLSDTRIAILASQWQLDKDLSLQFSPEPLSVSVSSHCWLSRQEGKLCTDGITYKDKVANWQLTASELPLGLWLYELFPSFIASEPDSTLGFSSSGSMDAEQNLQASFNLDVTPATWQLGEEGQVGITLETLSTQGSLKDNTLNLKTLLQSPEVGEINADFAVNSVTSAPELDGKLQIKNWTLAPFKPLSEQIIALQGNINGEVAIGGSPSAPNVNGELVLDSGHIEAEGLPVAVNQWQQRIEFVGQSADFTGEFLLGDGPGTLTGNVDWQDQPSVDVTIKGEAFSAQYDQSQLRISPDITASITPGNIAINGNVNIPWARIKIEDLPPNAVSPSSDVHLRGEPPSDDLVDIINANVMVNIDRAKSEEVRIEAFGLTAKLHGGIEVHTQPALTGYGDLQILDGRYEAYGQNLIIRTGEVQFNGPIDQPLLLVEAIRDPDLTDNNVIAGVRIDGSVDQPNVSLFSEPAMDQARNLAYLLNGSAGLSDGEMDQNAYASLLLGFGLSRSEGLTSGVGEALGIEDFSVSTTGQGDNTKLAISGKIAKDLTIRYGVGVLAGADSNGQEVALRYQLMPDLYLEIVRSLYAAVDLYYQFTLGERGKEDENDEEASTPQDQ